MYSRANEKIPNLFFYTKWKHETYEYTNDERNIKLPTTYLYFHKQGVRSYYIDAENTSKDEGELVKFDKILQKRLTKQEKKEIYWNSLPTFHK
jgi:hypothetical protein